MEIIDSAIVGNRMKRLPVKSSVRSPEHVIPRCHKSYIIIEHFYGSDHRMNLRITDLPGGATIRCNPDLLVIKISESNPSVRQAGEMPCSNTHPGHIERKPE